MEVSEAYRYCQGITRTQARNFYYAFITLPGARRKAIYAAYAFFRLCDDIADEDLPVEEKRLRLAQCRTALAAAYSGHAKDIVLVALMDAATRFGIPQDYFPAVITGVEMDLTKTRYQSFSDLRDYCYHVASVVGLICIEVFGYKDDRAKQYAVDLGLGMQLTNIIRDVKEDAQRDRIYIPLDEMARFGYSEAQLKAGVVNEAFAGLIQFQAQRARTYLQSGKRLFPLLSWRSRACPAVLHGLYARLLDHIEERDFDVFRERVHLSTLEKLLLTARVWTQSVFTKATATSEW